MAAVVNTRTALVQPQVYLEYADLALSSLYRGFILGWFSRHVQAFVLLIAAGQLTIAALLASPRVLHRRLGATGAVVFLLAISPLGVGSGFPFSLTFGAALLLSVGLGTVDSLVLQGINRWTPRVARYGRRRASARSKTTSRR